MAIKDLVFGLSLNSSKFDRGMKSAQAELKKLGASRLEGLRKEMRQLQGATDKASKVKFRGLVNEMKTLQNAMKVTRTEADKTGNSFRSVFAGSTLGTLAGNAGTAIARGIVRGVRAGYREITGAISQAFEARKIDQSLKDSLGKIGQGGSFGALDEFSGKMQRAFGIDDEDIRKGFTTMIKGGMDVSKVMKTASLVADIAAKQNISYAEASDLVTKAYNGETRGLRQLGIFIAETGNKAKDGRAAILKMQEVFSGSAGTLSGSKSPFDRMKLAVEEITTSFGNKLIPIVLPFVQRITDFLNEALETGQLGAWMDTLVSGFRTASNIVVSIADFFAGMFDRIQNEGIMGLLAPVGSFLAKASLLILNTLGHIGKDVWDDIVSGSKELVAMIGQGLIIKLQEVLGPKISKMLGLQDAAKGFAYMADTVQPDREAKRAANQKALMESNARILGPRTAPRNSIFDSFAATAEAGRQRRIAEEREIYSKAGDPGQSARAIEFERQKAAKSSKAFVKQHNMKLQVSSYDSNVHPIAGLS